MSQSKAQFEPGRSQARWRENAKALPHQEAAALEARLYPERAPLARVVLTSGSFCYDPRDDADVVRIARLIADEPELASLDHDDLRSALASSATAQRSTFEPEHPRPESGVVICGKGDRATSVTGAWDVRVPESSVTVGAKQTFGMRIDGRRAARLPGRV